MLLVAIDLRLIVNGEPPTALVMAPVVNGCAIVSSDFVPNNHGFVDIAIVNRGMTDETAGATVQRVLEIETYRCFALLGLPVAERAARVIEEIEHELPGLMERMDSASTLDDNRDLLDRLTSMTLKLERSSALTHFRFGATRAYAELVRLRLEALKEHTDPGASGLAAFFSRRFDPAIRTCATVSDRAGDLARKLTRAAQLLRTRVEVALESQNRDLLETMSDRVRIQLRLQQTVEGLSVAAISYYVASLTHLFMFGLRSFAPWADPDLMTGFTVLPIVVTVALAVRRIRRQHYDHAQFRRP